MLVSAVLALSLAAAPPALPCVVARERLVILTGKIQRLNGNRLPGPVRPGVAGPLAGQEVVVVLGRVEPMQFGDPFLPVSELRAPLIGRGRSDASGAFAVRIASVSTEPLDVTLLLVVPGGYYLNSFAQTGAFASLTIGPTVPGPVLLVDDRDAVF